MDFRIRAAVLFVAVCLVGHHSEAQPVPPNASPPNYRDPAAGRVRVIIQGRGVVTYRRPDDGRPETCALPCVLFFPPRAVVRMGAGESSIGHAEDAMTISATGDTVLEVRDVSTASRVVGDISLPLSMSGVILGAGAVVIDFALGLWGGFNPTVAEIGGLSVGVNLISIFLSAILIANGTEPRLRKPRPVFVPPVFVDPILQASVSPNGFSALVRVRF